MKYAGRLWWVESGVAVAIAVAAMVGIIGMQRSQLKQPSLNLIDPAQAENQEALKLQFLQQFPTFGFDNLVADWVFLNFLQYYGDTPAREQTGYSLSPAYFDIITRRDPRFIDSYLFLSGAISYQLGKPALAIKLMDRGTDALSPHLDPKAFQVWRFKGLDQLLLLGDVPGSIHSHEMAAKWVAGTPDAWLQPLYQQTAAFLRKDPNSRPVRLQAWATVFSQALAVDDKQTQQRARTEIQALGGDIKIDQNGRIQLIPSSKEKKEGNKR